jgi:hypothetical protein
MKTLRLVFVFVLLLTIVIIGSVSADTEQVDNTTVNPDPVVAGNTVYIYSELTYNTGGGPYTATLCAPADWAAQSTLNAITPTSSIGATWTSGTTASGITVAGVTLLCSRYTTNDTAVGWDAVQWNFVVSASATVGSGRPVQVRQLPGDGGSGSPYLQTVYTTVQGTPTTRYVGNTNGDCGGNSPCDTGTAGLANAIGALPASGGTVIIGGQYLSGGASVGSKNITLQPLNSSAELRADSGCGGGAPIVLNGTGNLTIDGLTLNGTGAPSPACADGVLVSGSASGNLTIQNSGNSVYGWPSDGIEVSSGSSAHIVINNSSVRNNTSDGVNMNSGTLSAVNSSFSNNGGSGISANGGTVTVENSTLSSNTDGVYNNGAALTLRGNTIENNSSHGFTVAGGTNVAYANNFNGNNSGGFQAYVVDPDDAAKNWWGSHTNSAVGPTTDNINSYAVAWDARLGAAVNTWAAGTDSVALGSAQLTRTGGSAADGVIISFGRASANAPFGNGVPPYVNQACSPFYDFYALGSPTNWRVTLPIDNTTDCNSNVLTQEIAYTINNVAECATADNMDCWDRINDTNILVNSNTLLIDNLDLSGTHIVSGDSSGGLDPTAINLLGNSAGQNQLVPAVLLAIVLFGMAATGIAVRRRHSN